MTAYTHALVLIGEKKEGTMLLCAAAGLAARLQMKITLAHISTDYRGMNYLSDSLMDDAVSADVLRAKAFLSALVARVPGPVDVCELVTLHPTDDLNHYIAAKGIDLVVAGHRNRFMAALISRSAQLINHLTVDVLITHIADGNQGA